MLLVLLLLPTVFSQECVYTYNHQSGNRMVEGTGTFPRVKSLTIAHPELEAKSIAWLVGKESSDGTLYWFASDKQRKVWTFSQQEGETKLLGSAAIPTQLYLGSYEVFLPNDTSSLSHPVCLPNHHVLHITEDGDIALIDENGDEVARKKLNILRDGRLVLNKDSSMVAFYAGASNKRYRHSVLGDDVEGTVLKVLKTKDLSDFCTVNIPENAVFEGLSPFWVDFDGDGKDDLVSTVGAALYIAHANGSVLGRTEPIGHGFHWRHQLMAGKFGPDKEMELVDIKTPHLGQYAEFFQLKADKRLEREAARQGYTSHVYTSRNLDMAVGGDFNGDGFPELLVPSGSLRRIVSLQRKKNSSSLVEMWSFWLGTEISSNIAAISLRNGRLALGVGLSDGRIKVFVPE